MEEKRQKHLVLILAREFASNLATPTLVADEVGTLVKSMRAMQERHPAIGDVRGRGAMLAVELVRPGTLEPDRVLTGRIARACHAQGVVLLTPDE